MSKPQNTKRLLFEFVKHNQPCSIKDLVAAGFKQSTVSAILSAHNLYKRKAKAGTKEYVYWIDSGKSPMNRSNTGSQEILPIVHHPIHAAFFGLSTG